MNSPAAIKSRLEADSVKKAAGFERAFRVSFLGEAPCGSIRGAPARGQSQFTEEHRGNTETHRGK
jgi:uncharacterized membrane protein